jgi:hypothetical protein
MRSEEAATPSPVTYGLGSRAEFSGASRTASGGQFGSPAKDFNRFTTAPPSSSLSGAMTTDFNRSPVATVKRRLSETLPGSFEFGDAETDFNKTAPPTGKKYHAFSSRYYGLTGDVEL